MKLIEKIIRAPPWTSAQRALFFEHLSGRISDDVRASYCERRAAVVLAQGGRRREAVELADWAIKHCLKASARALGACYAIRGEAKEGLRDYWGAAHDYLEARGLYPDLATPTAHAARNLFRAAGDVASSEIEALDRHLELEASGAFTLEEQVWTQFMRAEIAARRGRVSESKAFAILAASKLSSMRGITRSALLSEASLTRRELGRIEVLAGMKVT